MTRLLVSVRDAREAEIAIAEGVDLIDVKEPARQRWAPPMPARSRRLPAQWRVARRCSAALGELLEAISMPPRLASQLRYAKFGLAGCARHGDWKDRWQRAIANLPAGVSAVAVAYADVNAAHSPEVETVLANARAVGCAAVLFDTFGKSEGSLVDHLGLSRLNHLIAEARRVGLLTVVAGGLNGQRIRQILPLEPDYVGVRGAACRGDRSGRLDRRRVSKLVALVGDAVSDSACTPVR